MKSIAFLKSKPVRLGIAVLFVGAILALLISSEGAKQIEQDPVLEARMRPLFQTHGIKSPITVQREKGRWSQKAVVRFEPAEPVKRLHGEKQVLLLPMAAAGYAVNKWAPEVDSIEIQSVNAAEDVVRLKADVDDVRDFIAKKSTLDEFAERTMFEVETWQPRGKTPEERAKEYLERGRVFAIDKHDLPTALACYEASLRESPGNVDALYSIGVMKLNTQDTAGAAESLEQALKIDPNDYRSHACLAVVSLAVNQKEKAGHHLERFEDLRQNVREISIINQAAFHRAIHAYAQLGNPERSLALAKDCAERYPKSVETQILYAKMLFSKKKRKDALKVFKGIMEIPSDNPYVWQDVAWHLNELGDFNNASLAARRSYTLGNRDAAIFLMLSYSYLQQKRFFDSKHAATEGLKRHPGDKDLENNFKVAHRNIVRKRLKPQGRPTPLSLDRG